MRRNPVQVQQLIVTIYGLYGGLWSDEVPVRTLVAMLELVGVEQPAARATISRLKARGDLISRVVEGRACYALAESARTGFSANARVLEPSRSAPQDPWSLIVFSVPEPQRHLRHALKRELGRLGFGFVGAGVAVAPAHLLDEALDRLQGMGLDGFVDCFDGASYRDRGDIAERVAQWWDLESIAASFTVFHDAYRYQGRRRSAANPEEFEREAFARYVPMFTLWRELPYRDPNLPLEFLPDDWMGPQVKRTFLRLHALWSAPAAAYAESLAARDQAPSTDPGGRKSTPRRAERRTTSSGSLRS